MTGKEPNERRELTDEDRRVADEALEQLHRDLAAAAGRPPAGTDTPDGPPSTNALLIAMSLKLVYVPPAAAWNSSVGAFSPASHPAIAGTASRARPPISVLRATDLPKLARITANASSVYVTGGGTHSR